ncbi:hypothetical protein LXJ56_26470, partial [Escherichia coli]|nr:hypothetical protein [Escherichia coli]
RPRRSQLGNRKAVKACREQAEKAKKSALHDRIKLMAARQLFACGLSSGTESRSIASPMVTACGATITGSLAVL